MLLGKLPIIASVICLVWTSETSAQAAGADSWRFSAQLSTAIVLNGTDWSISHPIYSAAGGVTWETIRGTFEERMLFQASLELRRMHLAVRGTVGVLPQQFTQVAPAQDEDLRLILGGLSAVLYPLAKSGRSPEPYLAAGVGGQKATGGMTNTGFYLSGMAGIRVPLLAPIALDGGVQVLRLKYTQIELTAPPGGIQQDVRINPVAVFLGARIGG